MRRREFITILGGAAITWPVAGRTQSAMTVIGFLGAASEQAYATQVAAFRTGLHEAGYREGQNVAVEYRWAEDRFERLPTLAADLVRRGVILIVAATGPAATAAKASTPTIPIVFQAAFDPVAVGLVASLNKPGANITGVTTLGVGLGSKRLELLHDLIPNATGVGVLLNPANRTNYEFLSREVQSDAGKLGLQLHILQASAEEDFDRVFDSLVRLRLGGLVIGGDAFFTGKSEQLAALSVRHSIPAIYQSRQFANAGGLMSYGGNETDAYRLVGLYTGRILKGEKPGDLPVQQVTRIQLIINLKSARAFGLEVPASLIARADEVIE